MLAEWTNPKIPSFTNLSARLCTYVDDQEIQALTEHYATEFKDGDDVLDICYLWLRTNDLEHVFIVGSLFHFTTGIFEEPPCVDVSPNHGRPDHSFIIKGVRKITA